MRAPPLPLVLALFVVATALSTGLAVYEATELVDAERRTTEALVLANDAISAAKSWQTASEKWQGAAEKWQASCARGK